MVLQKTLTLLAHSTKGRSKVLLDKEVVTVDDVAYFAESHVARRMYSDGTSKTKNRFFIQDFEGLDQKGNTAEIRFTVLDKKTNTAFEDGLTIERGWNGVWQHHPRDGGPAMAVHTYVRKDSSSRRQVALGVGASAAALACGLSLLIRRRRKGVVPSAPPSEKEEIAAGRGANEA